MNIRNSGVQAGGRINMTGWGASGKWRRIAGRNERLGITVVKRRPPTRGPLPEIARDRLQPAPRRAVLSSSLNARLHLNGLAARSQARSDEDRCED